MVADYLVAGAGVLDLEFAMYRAPLLAAVLMSGHVRRGDMVEVGLPYPEMLGDVMLWVYTGERGEGPDWERVKENVKFLGGMCE